VRIDGVLYMVNLGGLAADGAPLVPTPGEPVDIIGPGGAELTVYDQRRQVTATMRLSADDENLLSLAQLGERMLYHIPGVLAVTKTDTGMDLAWGPRDMSDEDAASSLAEVEAGRSSGRRPSGFPSSAVRGVINGPSGRFIVSMLASDGGAEVMVYDVKTSAAGSLVAAYDHPALAAYTKKHAGKAFTKHFDELLDVNVSEDGSHLEVYLHGDSTDGGGKAPAGFPGPVRHGVSFGEQYVIISVKPTDAGAEISAYDAEYSASASVLLPWDSPQLVDYCAAHGDKEFTKHLPALLKVKSTNPVLELSVV
jgi:hypothetical protein